MRRRADGSARPDGDPASGPGRRHGHRWLMLACCVPMLVVVAALLVSGTASVGTVAFAVVCVALMTLVMLAMPRGH